MALRDKINKLVENTKETKADRLLKYKEDIDYMLKNKITINKQIELIIEEKILDKITVTEYRKILVKHFNYKINKYNTSNKNTNVIQKKEVQKTPIKNKISKPKTQNTTNILSNDIDMSQFRN